MGTSDEVVSLRSQGVSDSSIVDSLRSKGISPKEISDAMSQAQIKSAVGGVEPGMESSIVDTAGSLESAAPVLNTEYSGGSVDQGSYSEVPSQDLGNQTNNSYDAGNSQMAPMVNDYSAPQAGASSGEEYYQEDYGGYGGGDTDTIIEVAEQVFSEKSKKMKKQLSESNEFKTLATSKIEDISNRLKRIESSMDKLQYAILDKVGEYGNGLNSIKKEMSMMQDSFKKVVSEGKK